MPLSVLFPSGTNNLKHEPARWAVRAQKHPHKALVSDLKNLPWWGRKKQCPLDRLFQVTRIPELAPLLRAYTGNLSQLVTGPHGVNLGFMVGAGERSGAPGFPRIPEGSIMGEYGLCYRQENARFCLSAACRSGAKPKLA